MPQQSIETGFETPSGESGEIRLADVIAVLRQGRRVVLLTPLILFVCAVIYLHIAEPRYSVTLKVTPTASATSTLPAGISGLADLTGFAIPAGNENFDFDLYLEGLQSRETAAAVATNEDLLRELFPEDWDAASKAWRRPPGLASRIGDWVKAILGVPSRGWHAPDAVRVNEFLDDELRIQKDRASPVVIILIEHRAPEVAQKLLSQLHKTVDASLRQKELDRTGAYVAYLRDQLANVSVTEYRQALHDILAEQEKRRMVASSNLPFAAEPFGKPTISVEPTSPRPLFVTLSSLLLGLLAGIVGAFVLNQYRRERAGVR